MTGSIAAGHSFKGKREGIHSNSNEMSLIG